LLKNEVSIFLSYSFFSIQLSEITLRMDLRPMDKQHCGFHCRLTLSRMADQ